MEHVCIRKRFCIIFWSNVGHFLVMSAILCIEKRIYLSVWVCVCQFVSLFLMHGHSFEWICMMVWRVASLYSPDGQERVSEHHEPVGSRCTCRPCATVNDWQAPSANSELAGSRRNGPSSRIERHRQEGAPLLYLYSQYAISSTCRDNLKILHT